MNLHKIMIGIGIALIVFIPIWIFMIVPELEKLPGDYYSEVDIYGTENIYNIETNEFGGEEVVRVLRKVRVKENLGNKMKINDFFSSAYLNGEVFYKTDQDFIINRQTRKIEGTNAYFEFPRNVENKDYTIWFYYLTEPFPVKYEGQENIFGLETYLFTYELEFDATSGFSESDELVPETYNVKESPKGKIWVEPITGIIIKLEDEGIDHYVEKTENVLTAPVVSPTFKWTARYREDTIANQVRIAQNEKQKIYLIEWIIPILLALVGIALIFASFIGRKFIDYKKPASDSTPVKKTLRKAKKTFGYI